MDHTVVEAAVTTDASSQQLQDIQSYLATFNKEIGDGTGTTITSLPTAQQLFVQNQGQTSETVQHILENSDGVQSFIQTNADVQGGVLLGQNTVDGSQASVNVPFMPVTMEATSGLGGIQTDNSYYISQGNQGQFVQNVGEATPVVIDPASMVMDNSQQGTSTEEDQEESVILNTGNSYQTVTIVPTSEVNQSGEVSYVLIVSQPDEEKNNTDMSVFDFKEEKGVTEGMDEEAMDEDGASTSEPKKSVAHLKFAAARRAPVTQLMCNYCNYTSAKRYLLTRHMKTHSEERPHKCNICDRGFKTIASLQNHINTHTGVKPHKCKECDATFTTSGELVRHVRYRHTFEKPHKCPDCDYASVELSKLKRHIRSHTGERPYQCPHCSYASPDTYKLKRHLRIHTGEKPYECDICHARFTQSNSLKAHRLIHTGDKPVFQCELCPTTCGRKTDLKIHVQKLHTSEEPILCKKCGKSFPDRYTFKIHIKTHDGEKCFRCELCPYAAMSQRHLESHILTHTGEKPFKCNECDMSFRQKQLLRRHKNLYHTPDYTPPTPKEKQHQCIECGKNFAHRGNMLRHMAIHDPDNPLYQEINIMKVEEEEARQAMEIARMEAEEEEDSDGIPEGEPDESFEQQNPRQVQVQLVNEDGEHAGQIYLQLENPDGTIPEGEPIPVTTTSEGAMNHEYTSSAPEQRIPHIVKVEPNTSHHQVAIVQNIQEGIPSGEYDSTEHTTTQVITTVSQTNNGQRMRGAGIQHQADVEESFGFNQEDGIPPGEN